MGTCFKFAKYINVSFPSHLSSVMNVDENLAKMFRLLMTDEEAEVGLSLTKVPTTAAGIAAKAGKSIEEVEAALNKLADNGAIFVEGPMDNPLFKLIPFAPGILEFQCKPETLSKEMAEVIEADYLERAEKVHPNYPRGSMRIIPVREAIIADPKHLSFEDIMTYIDNNTDFGVSPCLCRSMKKKLGQGCGHTIEDMCVITGPFVDYYERTGRGRRVTKEYVIEICRKANEEGLVNNVFNFEEDNSLYICHCCGCCCVSLRSFTMLNMRSDQDMPTGGTSPSNYQAQVDEDKCVACGACVDICPVNALQLGDSVCHIKSPAPETDDIVESPYDTDWTKEKWDMDWLKRKIVTDGGTSPCKTECPAHISVQGYIKLASQGKYTEALKLIKRDNPFPAVCGRVCPHLCEGQCSRADIDEPLAIDPIKRFIADQDMKAETRYIPEIKVKRTEKVAVVGAGPAGLSCAYYLAVEGYQVTVFEKQTMLGGMLTMGMPSFRLDRDAVKAEIDIIRELGVEFKTGVEVGKDITIPQLRAEGYEAFFIAIGAQQSRKLGLEGENLPGVIGGVDFLRDVNLGKKISLNGPVVVIGGGNVAVDVARTAVRAGATSVEMFSLESREDMPAWEDELAEAIEEGVKLNPSWGPKVILQKDGKVTGIEFKKCTSVFDADNRFNPTFDENEGKTVEATTILGAIGQGIDWGTLLQGSACQLTDRKTIEADVISLQTNDPDIFAGGDSLTGPKIVIDSIAAGKQASISIHRFLRGNNLTQGREREYQALDKRNLDTAGYDRLPRQHSADVDPKLRVKSFDDLSTALTEEQIHKETERCLGCGAVVVNKHKCIGCGDCTLQCDFDAIKLVRVSEVRNPTKNAAEFNAETVKYVHDRQQRLAEKKDASLSGKTN